MPLRQLVVLHRQVVRVQALLGLLGSLRVLGQQVVLAGDQRVGQGLALGLRARAVGVDQDPDLRVGDLRHLGDRCGDVSL
ncbi:hypothetical protein D3C79_949540 [compost metagenome]